MQDKLGLGAVSKKAVAREQQRQREAEAQRRAATEAAAAEAGRQGQRQDYQQRSAAAAAARRLEGQLRKAQTVCETLDTAAGIAASVMWRQQQQQPPAAGLSAAGGARLAAVAVGAGAGDDELLEQAEPCCRAEAGAAVRAGREETAEFEQLYQRQAAAAEAAAKEAAGEPEEPEGDAEWAAWQALPPGAQLAAVLEHLRGRYCYCLYCGCRYEDADDMQQHCPGPSEGDHE